MARYSRAKVIKTVRAVIRDRDSLVQTRPPVVRGVTSPVTTTPAAPFDDRATIVFVTASTGVQYPFGFKQGDINLVGSREVMSASTPGLGYPNRGGGLVTVGPVVSGVPDAYVRDIPGSLLSYRSVDPHPPFVEQQLHASEAASFDDPFYQTGSRAIDVGPGLEQPLWSKTRVQIDLDPVSRMTFGYTQQASAGNQQPKYTPMVYFNFGSKTWDVVGRPVVAAGFSTDTDFPLWLNEAPIGFTRGTQLLLTSTNMACLPCSNFGFPVHPKFHAKPDYSLCMSGVIDRPFLLEKFVYEADVEYLTGTTTSRFDRMLGSDAGSVVITNHAASVMTFFMLNQRSPSSASIQFVTEAQQSGQTFSFLVTASLPTDMSLSGTEGQTHVDTTRDLVAYAQVVSFSGSNNPTALGSAGTTMSRILASGLARDLNVDVSSEGTNTSMSRRVIMVSGSARQTLRLERQFGWRLTNAKTQSDPQVGYMSGANVPGGRSNRQMSMTGRDFNASQPGGVIGSTAVIDIGNTAVYPSPTANTITSPYLLMPSDKLVFGWQAPHLFDGQVVSASQASALQGTGPQVTLYPGKGKLTLYGSLLRDGREYHDTLRQPLVSDAVSEVLHSDNPVLDQFDTEPFYQLSGSYIDNLVSGAMRNTNAARGVFANNANPGAPAMSLGTTLNDRLVSVNELKSTTRTVSHVCPSELYFDCLLPNPTTVAHLDGASVQAVDLGGKDVGLIILDTGVRFGANASQVDGDPTWSMAYPFEPRYSSAKRELAPFAALTVDKLLVGTSSISVSNKVVQQSVIARPMRNITNVYGLVILLDGDIDTGGVFALRDDDARKHYYGIGDLNTFVSSSVNTTGSHNVPGPRAFLGSAATGYGVLIRGWKYGIKNGVHERSKAVFRRDRYGQHRDMLEQRLDGKFYVLAVEGLDVADKHTSTTGEATSPVTVGFFASDGSVTEPNQTYSSNLSHEATSSLPYFDGAVRNREDPLDLSLLNNAPANV